MEFWYLLKAEDACMLAPNKNSGQKGLWVAQWVKCPTLGLGSVHDLKVISPSPVSGCAQGVLKILALLLPLPLLPKKNSGQSLMRFPSRQHFTCVVTL